MVAMAVMAPGLAGAQLPLPSPAALAEQAQPLRVVCVADAPEVFLRDETFRDRVLARLPAALSLAEDADAARRLRPLVVPLGRRFLVPVGTAFVVDPARRHLVTNWHVVTACIGEPRSGRQLGVLEAEGVDVVVHLAEHLPDRSFQDATGRSVKLVQVVCRNQAEPCDADLPRSGDERGPGGVERRRQLGNLLTYAPDLAVLRLAGPVRAAPLALALHQQLDDQLRLVVRGFGPVPVGASEADAAARLHLATAVSHAAVYTGPHQVNALAPGGRPEDEVHARLHRLAANLPSGDAGAPVMRGQGVVGVLTTMLDPVRDPGSDLPADRQAPAYAVPVTVLAGFLNLLEVPYITAALDQPPRPAAGDPLLQPPATAVPWWGDPQRLMLGSAAALAVLAVLAFLLLARRRPVPAQSPRTGPPPGTWPTQARTAARTAARIDTSLLHAVAMPTTALDTPPVKPMGEGAVPQPSALPGSAAPLAGAARVHLRASASPLADSVFSLPMPNGGTTLFVGRDPQSCQVVFPAATAEISAVHACFVWDAGQRSLGVRDLSSSGTWCNGERMAKGRTVPLADGDRVDLGGPDINRFTIALPGTKSGQEVP
jgi:hypothetical protein